MLHTHKFVLFGLSIAWTAVAQTASPETESWLFQGVHLVGDVREGFRKTCLIVYRNGEYRRERRRQLSTDGRAQSEWEAPETLGGKLSPTDLGSLQTILETPGFSSIHGVIGNSSLTSKLLFDRQGAVTPEENIDILTIAVARPDAPQVFELAEINLARRQEPVRALLDWIKVAERSGAQGVAASKATNCSPLAATSNALVGGAPMAMGVSFPKAIYMPSPEPPHSTRTPQPVTVVLLVGPDGNIVEANLKSRLSTDVAQSVLDTVRKWKFEPARLVGVPIAKTISLKVEFRGK